MCIFYQVAGFVKDFYLNYTIFSSFGPFSLLNFQKKDRDTHKKVAIIQKQFCFIISFDGIKHVCIPLEAEYMNVLSKEKMGDEFTE